MELETLKDLYIHELKDLYSAETQIIKALPKMAKAASNEQLKAGFELHLKKRKSTPSAWRSSSQSTSKRRAGRSAKAWRVC
jgi:ferritin-like metal-binding protein YciE